MGALRRLPLKKLKLSWESGPEGNYPSSQLTDAMLAELEDPEAFPRLESLSLDLGYKRATGAANKRRLGCPGMFQERCTVNARMQ